MADRYQKYTRNLSADDYKGWAAGIKAGGYATAKNYVSTIVGVIEGANLQKYDQMVIEQAKNRLRERVRRLAPQTTARGMCLPLLPIVLLQSPLPMVFIPFL